jgi:hypothetical protein
MSGTTEIFVATHDVAVRRATELEASVESRGETDGPMSPVGDAPSLRLNGVTDLEIEILGGLAAKAVGAAGGESLDMADVSSDYLMVAPDAMVQSLAELLTHTDDAGASLIPEVASLWAAEEDMPFSGDIAEDHVRRIAQLASQAETAERQELYVWSNTAEA